MRKQRDGFSVPVLCRLPKSIKAEFGVTAWGEQFLRFADRVLPHRNPNLLFQTIVGDDGCLKMPLASSGSYPTSDLLFVLHLLEKEIAMLGVVLALLLQAADPVQPVEPVAQAQTEATQAAEAEPEQVASEEGQTRERRCRGRNLTGTRLSTLVVCRTRNGQQNYDTRQTLRQIQRVELPAVN